MKMNLTKTNLNILLKIFQYFIIILFSCAVLLFGFLIFWYNYCFFPYDQDYLQQISDSVEYKGDHLEEKEFDLLRELGNARFTSPIEKKDLDFLLSQDLRIKDIYIDKNPYGKNNRNNLKYSTGRIFYYIYQKNSLVLKANSGVSFNLSAGKTYKRFFELEAVLPAFTDKTAEGKINIIFNGKVLLNKKINPETKPEIKPFRYSDVLSSVSFYLKHPGRSVLTNSTGWEKIRIDIPAEAGNLSIEFKSGTAEKNYVFLGSPAVYSIYENNRNDHVNIVYLIFDTLAKSYIDLYENFDVYSKNVLSEAYSLQGKRKILTPSIDKYKDRICLLEHMITVGQVTRPAIVPLWTSQIYTKSRLPVFRNIVTEENQDEFNSMGFDSLGNILSKNGYFTKQISCNSQGHGVSGVGVDLGFDENYDFTMEATEKTVNFRRIIEFLRENQNRKFFLYSHINVPHPPKWIPMRYFISSLSEAHYNIESAKMIGNIKYLNDSLGKLLNAIERLKLLENTIVIITADHSGSRVQYLRGDITGKDRKSGGGDSQAVAAFHPGAIYVREGSQHLLNVFMNIPWILIKPSNTDFIPGKIDSYISSLDISPTLLDITVNKTGQRFSGKSFKGILSGEIQRDKTFTDFIPLVGRFQRGFILDGRYKYWINIQGLYKYREAGGKRYIMQQEYLYDLSNDPYELYNMAHDTFQNDLLNKMRKIYFERFTDYPDKNFFQISPSKAGGNHRYTIKAVSAAGKIIFPKTYGEEVKYKYPSNNEIFFDCAVKEKAVFFSFETDPPDAALTVYIYKDGGLMKKTDIYSAVECINYFDNPITLNDRTDFSIAREPGKAGLEKKDIPEDSLYYSRIQLNYWMEMNLSDKDIRLSPGIKEVLRGWGYIQ